VILKVRLFATGLLLSGLILAAIAGAASADQRVSSLISTGPAGGNSPTNPAFYDAASADGTHVYFDTDEQLVSADTDNSFDVYERVGTTTNLVSIGPNGGNGANDAFFDGISQDGTKLFFESDEKLVSGDTDSSQDVYQRSSGATTQVSTGPSGGNGAPLAFFDGASADGSRVFFDTEESLVSVDTDSSQDLYERFSGATTDLSIGPTGGNGAIPAFFDGSSQDGTTVFYETGESLVGGDTDSSIDVYAAKVASPSPGYDVPRAASSLHAPLVPEFRQTIDATQCSARGGLNSTHGSPVALPSCNPPAFVPGTQAHFGVAGDGSVDLTMIQGDPGTPADEADLAIAASLSDIRLASASGADYAPSASGPDVSVHVKLRLSDTTNATTGQPCAATTTCPGTMSDYEFSAPVNCAVTADPSVGSNCSVVTSADGVIPTVIKESRNSVLQTFRVRVHDAGANGTVGDGDDARMASQGIYIP